MKNLIGWSGALLFLVAYFLLATNLIVSNSYTYNIMQLFGAILLAYRVWLDKNYSNLTLEIVMILVAIYKIGGKVYEYIQN